VRLWRKSGPPEPAAAHPAAAGARYGSEKERLKGDVQELARQRIVVASALFAVVFCAVALRMGYVSLLRDSAEPTQRVAARGGTIQSERADIVDRNGVVFATSVPVMSAFVNPHLLLDTADAARKIVSALPEFKYEDIKDKLDADKSFLWIKRGLSPRALAAPAFEIGGDEGVVIELGVGRDNTVDAGGLELEVDSLHCLEVPVRLLEATNADGRRHGNWSSTIPAGGNRGSARSPSSAAIWPQSG